MYGRPHADYDNDFWPQSSHQGPMPSNWRFNRPHQGVNQMPYGSGFRRPLMDDAMQQMANMLPGMVGPQFLSHQMGNYNYSDIDHRLPQSAIGMGMGRMDPAGLGRMQQGMMDPMMGAGVNGAGGAVPTTYANDLYQDFNAPERPFDIKVEFTTTATMCNVTWNVPVQIERGPDFVFVVEAHGANHQSMQLPRWRTHLKMKTTPGQWYTVEVKAMVSERIIASGKTEFKAVFNRDEMIMLYKRALDYVGDSMHAFDVFYRCKPKPYFDNIKFNRSSIMEVYLKDNNGQAASPINGVISGLFWSARLTPNNQLPSHSPFGNIRMCVPAATLFDLRAHRLWFADFYCNYITHYVTVVVTLKGSETDAYCEKCLIPLPLDNNPFLQCVPSPDNPSWCAYWVNKKVWIETYYTENVPLNWGRFDEINATGAGTSKPGGLPHNKWCQMCNLYPVAAPPGMGGAATRDPLNQTANTTGGADDDDNYIEELDNDPAPSHDASVANEYNTTLHLCMQMERDRVAVADGKDGTSNSAEGEAGGAVEAEVGDNDVIETLCTIVDATVAEVGPLLKVPQHGFIGTAYTSPRLLSEWQDEKISKQIADLSKPAEPVASAEPMQTSAGEAAHQHLVKACEDIDRRTDECLRQLALLQQNMNALHRKIPIFV